MSEPKKTEWYSPTTKPAWNGVYERLFDGHAVRYALFDGLVWRVHDQTAEEAQWAREPSPFQNLPWRGLAKPEHGEG